MGKKFLKNLQLCKEIDGACMNPYCHSPYFGLSAHHIKHRSLGRDDSLENLITLCLNCHDKIENNKMDIIEDVLKYWIGKKEWRWEGAYNEILKRGKYSGL